MVARGPPKAKVAGSSPASVESIPFLIVCFSFWKMDKPKLHLLLDRIRDGEWCVLVGHDYSRFLTALCMVFFLKQTVAEIKPHKQSLYF